MIKSKVVNGGNIDICKESENDQLARLNSCMKQLHQQGVNIQLETIGDSNSLVTFKAPLWARIRRLFKRV